MEKCQYLEKRNRYSDFKRIFDLQDDTTVSYAKGKNFNVVFLPLRYSAGDTYRGSGLVPYISFIIGFRALEYIKRYWETICEEFI